MTDCRRALLARLVDDAGQFPPARKPLEEAVADHLAARSGPHAWMLGRFLCPASKLAGGLPQPLGVVSDGDWEADLERALALGADCFELRDPGPEAYGALGASRMRVYVEGAQDLELLAGHGLGAKIRCGGVTADAFPSDAAVAAFIGECRRLGLPFKATAGLHHPLRTRDEGIGVLQHGFLNLLAAAILDVEDLEAVVADTDPDAFGLDASGFAWRGHAADGAAVERGRRRFDAFGSCSFAEPVEDLERLGVLESARA